MIEVRQAAYQYEGMDRRAVDGVTLEIEPREMLAIIGPNGSGKSTLARLLSGLLVPCLGSVTVDGYDTRTASPQDVRRRISIVWQNPENQLVAGIVEDDVAFGPENLGLPVAEIDHRVDEALMRVGLSELRRAATDQLSAGEKQLVAVAGVLALEPRYLVLDEATARLDARAADRMLDAVMAWAADRDAGVIMITHVLPEVMRADRLCRMAAGRVVGLGPPVELLRQARFSEDELLQTPLYDIVFRLEELGVGLPRMPRDAHDLAELLCQ